MQEVWRGVTVVTQRELMRFVQERARIVAAFGQPLLYLLVFGAGFRQAAGSLTPGIDYLTFVYPGIIAMMVLQSSLTAGTSIVWERQMRLLRALLVAPVSRGGLLLGKVVWAALLGLLQAGVMVLVAPLLGIEVSPLLVLQLVPLVVILSLWLAGLGLLLGAWMQSTPTYQAWMQFVAFPLIISAGVFFPLDDVPAWLQVLATLNPATYGVDAIRQVFLSPLATGSADGHAALGLTLFGHQMSVLEDALVVAVISVVVIAVAVWSFNTREANS